MKIHNEKGLIHFANSGAPADKEGYLHKKGEVNKGYQKRWFVLKGNLLFYYEKKGDKDPQGVIILEGCTIELTEDVENFMFMINYASSGLRTYCLSAQSQESMESWMKALSCAGYEYVKLMVSELQSKLEEASISTEAGLVQAADRESKILGRMYKDKDSVFDDSSQLLLASEKKRVNPFNESDDADNMIDPGDAFRSISRNPSTVELVTWSLLQVNSFKEMHEFVKHQIEENRQIVGNDIVACS